MNRSAINWMIAASVLTAAAGVAAAPSAADTGPSGGIDAADSTPKVKHQRQTNKAGDTRPGRPRHHVRENLGPWPCDWQRCPFRRGNWGNNRLGLLIATSPAQRATQIPPFGPAAEPDIDLGPVLDAVDADQSGPVPPPASVSTPAAPAAPIAAATPVPARPAAAPPARIIPPVAPPPPAAPPVTPAAPPQPGGSDPGPSLRLGYPEELRNADLATVLALALPGLAAMVGMTAMGGVFGYRQAKAGYVVRTAGAGRFLQ